MPFFKSQPAHGKLTSKYKMFFGNMCINFLHIWDCGIMEQKRGIWAYVSLLSVCRMVLSKAAVRVDVLH
jgi:hypothetical protein